MTTYVSNWRSYVGLLAKDYFQSMSNFHGIYQEKIHFCNDCLQSRPFYCQCHYEPRITNDAYSNITSSRTSDLYLLYKVQQLQFDTEYLHPNFHCRPCKWNSFRPVSDTLHFVYHPSYWKRTFRKDWFCTNHFEHQQRPPYCLGKALCILRLKHK